MKKFYYFLFLNLFTAFLWTTHATENLLNTQPAVKRSFEKGNPENDPMLLAQRSDVSATDLHNKFTPEALDKCLQEYSLWIHQERSVEEVKKLYPSSRLAEELCKNGTFKIIRASADPHTKKDQVLQGFLKQTEVSYGRSSLAWQCLNEINTEAKKWTVLEDKNNKGN